MKRTNRQRNVSVAAATPHPAQSGQKSPLSGSYQDISKIFKETAALRRILAAAIEHINDGLVISQGSDWVSAKILFLNAAMRRMTGYSNDDVVGKSHRILNGKPADRSALNRIRRELSRAEASRAELTLQRKGGERLDAETMITVLPRRRSSSSIFVSVYRLAANRTRPERDDGRSARQSHPIDASDRQTAGDALRERLRALAAELVIAEEQERQRLAEDLHRGLGQALFRMRLEIDRASPADPKLEQLKAILSEAATLINKITFELSPPVLHSLGLRGALWSLATDLQNRYGLSIQIDDDGQPIELDKRVELLLFRSVRELLTNVVKHGQTDRANVSIRRAAGRLQIQVSDRGKGFPPPDRQREMESGRFGLFGIREHLQYLGGSFEIHSAPGKGVAVTLTAPFAAQRRSAAAAGR